MMHHPECDDHQAEAEKKPCDESPAVAALIPGMELQCSIQYQGQHQCPMEDPPERTEEQEIQDSQAISAKNSGAARTDGKNAPLKGQAAFRKTMTVQPWKAMAMLRTTPHPRNPKLRKPSTMASTQSTGSPKTPKSVHPQTDRARLGASSLHTR